MKLLCVAVKEELPEEVKGYHVVYTGVGKVQAAFALQRAIHQMRPIEVWNYGTAGSVSGKHSGLVEVDVILQRDMITEPLAPRGIIPYAENEHAGAIVFCNNTSVMDITVPQLSSGFTTTFIAKTSSAVRFVSQSPNIGLNSFQGANQLAGFAAQASIMYDCPSVAFLGGTLI